MANVRQGQLGPRARKARSVLARAASVGVDQVEIDRLRVEFRRAKAEEQIESARAVLAELDGEVSA